MGASAVKRFGTLDGLELVKLPRRLKVEEAIRLYRRMPAVLYVEPNFIVQALVVPNDPQLGLLWGLDNGGNTSRGVSGTGAQITVQTPRAGEAWYINRNVTIRWASRGLSGNVKIGISRDGGINWQPVQSNTSNDGEQTWKVTGPATRRGRIRVCNLSGVVCDTSDANFTIQRDVLIN